MITIAIPVGPHPSHQQWLGEAIASVQSQTVPCNILVIDDMAGLHCDEPDWDFGRSPSAPRTGYGPTLADLHDYPDVKVWRSPWRLGVGHAFNFGVALARDEEVLMLGADDTLEPDAIECYLAFAAQDPPELRARTYYGLPVRYMHSGYVQFEPCNAAIVSKALWRATGGFPVESASGAPDAAFLSQIWNSGRFRICAVGDRPLYNYRSHANTDTASRGPWQGVILETRNLLTELFKPDPVWGRYQ